MSENLEQNIKNVLSEIHNPITNRSIVNDISKIIIQEKSVTFAIYAEKDAAQEALNLREICIQKLKQIPELEKINISLTSRSVEEKPAESKKRSVQGVRKIILVASGKGGVGKSTVAVNLAIALSQLGKKVGIVDTDIYGPSIPTLLDINKKPALEDNMMIPLVKYGIKAMSIGLLVEEKDPLIWRGPMTTKMLFQLIRMTKWDFDGEELDYLIVDSPPGTGDVHLSLAENYRIDGAIIITLPQELSVKDARKSLAMCQKLEIPIIGIIENMSFIAETGLALFGKGGAKKLAKEFSTKVIANIPIYQDLAICSDMGKPLTYADPKHEVSKIFNSLASEIVK
jgi:ATP-binding protein involved in chromosome partitioning